MNSENKAILHLKKSLHFSPNNPDALLKLCEIYFAKSWFKEIDKLLLKYRECCETTGYIKAVLLLKKEEYDKASEKLFRIILDSDNPSQTYLKTAIEIEKKRKDSKKLSIYLELLIQKEPFNGWNHLELSKLLNPEIDRDRIIYLIDTANYLLLDHVEPPLAKLQFLWKNIGQLKQTSHETSEEEIIGELERLLTVHPTNKQLLSFLSEVYIEADLHKDTIRILNQIYDKQNTSINFHLGKAYFELNNFNKCIYYLTLSETNSFFAFDSYYYKSLAFRRLQDLKKFLLHQRKAYDVHKDYINLLEAEYDKSISTNQFGEAKIWIEKKFKARRKVSSLCLQLYLHDEKETDSHDFLSQSLNLNPKNHLALYHMGLRHKKRCLNESLSYFLKSLQEEWDFYEGHVEIADCYKMLDQKEKALRHQKIAKEIKK